jgi:hypothetical protein
MHCTGQGWLGQDGDKLDLGITTEANKKADIFSWKVVEVP